MAKFKIGNKEVEGEYVQFTPIKEEWNEYLVGNYGIKLKVVVTDIFRAKDQFDGQGNPVFFVKSSNVLNVRKVD